MTNFSNLPKVANNIDYTIGSIHFNGANSYKQIAEAADVLNRAIVSPETAKDVRKQLAEARGKIRETETQRKRVKGEMMKPIKQLDEGVKTFLEPLNKAIDNVNGQLKGLDEQMESIKEQTIFQRNVIPTCESRGLDPDEFKIPANLTKKSVGPKKIEKVIAEQADAMVKRNQRKNCIVRGRDIFDSNGEEIRGVKARKLTITYFDDDETLEQAILAFQRNVNVISVKGE